MEPSSFLSFFEQILLLLLPLLLLKLCCFNPMSSLLFLIFLLHQFCIQITCLSPLFVFWFSTSSCCFLCCSGSVCVTPMTYFILAAFCHGFLNFYQLFQPNGWIVSHTDDVLEAKSIRIQLQLSPYSCYGQNLLRTLPLMSQFLDATFPFMTNYFITIIVNFFTCKKLHKCF